MADTSNRLPTWFTSLSARLLMLTVVFVMLAEFLIWAPSISRFRKSYMEEQLLRAHLATLALEAMPETMPDRHLEDVLLAQTSAYGIVLKGPKRRTLMLAHDMPPEVDVTVDLRRQDLFHWIGQAFMTLNQDKNRVLRVIGMSPKRPEVTVELITDEEPMRNAMYAYSTRILSLSIVISLFTAGLVYLSLRWLMVRPIQRITTAITDFRRAPEDASRQIKASDRTDEIGLTERELAIMQDELRQALSQRRRLATLGAAVAKINHDLRNSLATAVLAFDKLAAVNDPEVKRVLPRLYDAVDRAVQLCSQTLDYAADTSPTLKPTRFHLQELIAEAAAGCRDAEAPGGPIKVDNRVPFEVDLEADRQQLYRLFSNLLRNSFEAGAGRVEVSAGYENGAIVVDLADDGPGLSDKARANLFKPFTGSTRKGGTGLGLVIAQDVVKAHGGDIEVVTGADAGARFRIRLPAQNGGRAAAD
jgi:signal transduction histidine kinase